MALNVELLRRSFALVAEREPEFTGRFYEILFARYPQVRPLFGRRESHLQAKMLQEAIVAVVDHLEDAPWLKSTLGTMGGQHVDYGVTPEMYPWVGDALIRTLAEIAGPEWSPELAAAWTEAYGAIASLMLAGTKVSV